MIDVNEKRMVKDRKRISTTRGIPRWPPFQVLTLADRA